VFWGTFCGIDRAKVRGGRRKLALKAKKTRLLLFSPKLSSVRRLSFRPNKNTQKPDGANDCRQVNSEKWGKESEESWAGTLVVGSDAQEERASIELNA